MKNFTKHLFKSWIAIMMFTSVAVTVNAQTNCVVLMSSVNNETCLGANDGSISIEPTMGTPPYTISWSNTPNQDWYQYGLGAGVYHVSVMDAEDCLTVETYTIASPNPDSCNIYIDYHNVNNFEMCNARNFIADVTVACRPVALEWDFGDDSDILMDTLWSTASTIYPNAMHEYMFPGNYSASLTVSDLTLPGCSQQVSYNVVINNPVEASVNVTLINDSRCRFEASATGGSGKFYYNWYINGMPFNSQVVNYVYANTGMQYFSMYAVDVDNAMCSSNIVDSILIETVDTCQLYANLNQPSFSGCSDVILTVTAANYSGQTGFDWEFGDGNYMLGNPVSHHYAEGNYEYTVWVSDTLTGCQVHLSQNINIAPVIGVIEASIIGTTVNFNISATGGSGQYNIMMMDFGDASMHDYSSSPFKTHTYPGDGIYNAYVVVNDANNGSCMDTAFYMVEINHCSAFMVMLDSIVNASDEITSDGAIYITVMGGTLPYNFMWSNNYFNEDNTGIQSGNYSLTLSDNSGCYSGGSWFVPVNAPVTCSYTIAATPSDATMEMSNGSIMVQVMGNPFLYAYSIDSGLTWTGFDTARVYTFYNLFGGDYNIAVRDFDNCAVYQTVTVNEAMPCNLVVTENIGPVTAPGGNDGFIFLSVSNGMPPYTFNWNPAVSGTDTVYNLSIGTYTVTITDSYSCTTVKQYEVTELAGGCPFSISTTFVNPDAGLSNGSITVSVTGSGPHSFYLNGKYYTFDTVYVFTFNGLAQGSYMVEVKDLNNCTQSTPVMLSETGGGCPFSLSVTTSNPDVGFTNGSISVHVVGSPGTYYYSLDGGITFSSDTTDHTFFNLPPGNYGIQVRNFMGCMVSYPVTLTEQGVGTCDYTLTHDLVQPTAGNSNGAITIYINGGMAASYMYILNGDTLVSGTTATYYNLGAGEYNFLVYDMINWCLQTLPVTLSSGGCSFGLFTHVSDYSAPNAWDGKIDIWPDNGGNNYTFHWDDGYYPNHRENLGARAYGITVTDNNTGCTGSTYLEVKDGPLYISYNDIIMGCNHLHAQAIVTGGSGNYSYNWWIENYNFYSPFVDFVSPLNKNHLAELVVSDDASNTVRYFEFIPLLGHTPVITISYQQGQDIAASLESGIDQWGYNIEWNMGDGQIWSNANTVSHHYSMPGTYTISVSVSPKTNPGCVMTAEQTVTMEGGGCSINLVPAFTYPHPGMNDGAITLSVSGGTPPYNFIWNDGSTQQNRYNLYSGSYYVTVMDADSCIEMGEWWLSEIQNADVYIMGDATPYNYVEWRGQLENGFVEDANQQPVLRQGMFEKMVHLDAAENFYIIKIYNGDTIPIGPVASELKGIDGSSGQMIGTILQGVIGENSNPFIVTQTGLHHVVIDFNTNTFFLVPVNSFGIIGNATPVGNWSSEVPLPMLVSNGDSVLFQIDNLQLNLGQFKLRYNNGWKVIVNTVMGTALADPFVFFTNFGGNFMYDMLSLVRGGNSYNVGPMDVGPYTLKFLWTPEWISGQIAPYNPCEFSVSGYVNNSDPNNADGNIVLDINGEGIYSYLWNDGITDKDRYNLASGIYTVTVSDGTCSLVKNYQVSGSWWGVNAYIMGNSTAYNSIESAASMECFEREGMFVKYLPVSGYGQGFQIITEYYGTTLNIGPVSVEPYALFGDGGNQVNAFRGQLGFNTNKFSVPADGFFEVVADLQSMTYYILPISSFGIVGSATPTGSWSVDTELLPEGNFSLNEMQFSIYNVTLNPGEFKFRHGHMWTVWPDASFLGAHANNLFFFHTNFGGWFNDGYPDLSPGGDNYIISPNKAGIYDITIFWNNNSGKYARAILKQGNCSYSVSEYLQNPMINQNNGQISLMVTGGQPPYNFYWDDWGWGSETRYNLAPGTYTVSITDQTGCPTTKTYTLVEQNVCGIVYNFNVTPATRGMSDGQVTVNITGGNGPFNVWWDNGASGNTIMNLQSGWYQVWIKDASNCQIHTNVYVGEQDPCLTADIYYNYYSCDSVSIGADIWGRYAGPVFRQWTVDGMVIGETGNNFNYKFTYPGQHNITLNITDTSGTCTASANEQILIRYIDPVAVNTTINANRVSFTANIPNQQDYYFTWYYGDGNYSYSKDPVHYYSSTGTYHISLTYGLNDNSTCYNIYDYDIVIDSIGPCDLNSASIQFTMGPNMTGMFDIANLLNPESWIEWYIDGGLVSQNPKFNYYFENEGQYNVCLNIFALYDTACHYHICQTINVTDIPCNIQINAFNLGTGGIELHLAGGMKGYDVYLYGNHGTYRSYYDQWQDVIYINNLPPELYNICVYDAFGCNNCIMYYYTPGGNGNLIDFTYNEPGNCAPAYIEFYNTSTIYNYNGVVNYIWTIDGVSYSGQNLQDYFFGGNHNVTLVAYDTTGMEFGRKSVNFNVQGYSHSLHTNVGTQVCVGQNVSFYTWDDFYDIQYNVNGQTGNYNGFSYQFNTPGVYTAYLTLWTNCGMVHDSLSITVTNTAIPEPRIMMNDGQACPGDKVQFHAYEGFTWYYWQFGDGDVSYDREPVHQYANYGQYTVTLSVKNKCGNQASTSTTMYINPNLQPNSEFNSPFDVCPNTPVEFHAHGSGNYFWQFGDGTISLDRNPVHYYTNLGYYPVILKVTNGCGKQSETVHYVSVMQLGGDVPYPRFSFGNSDENEDVDSLTACPGLQLKLQNRSDMWGDGNAVHWLINGTEMGSENNFIYTFNQPGFYTITLRISSACAGFFRDAVKYVNIDPAALPNVKFTVMPDTICPAENVLFWDEHMYNNIESYSYDIDFGDGQSITGVTGTIQPFDVIANHSYMNAGQYIYTFTAYNNCGNSISKTDTIVVDPTGNHEPFYYISNSTASDNQFAGRNVYIAPFGNEFYYLATDPSWEGTYQLGIAEGPNDHSPTVIAEGNFTCDSNTYILTFLPGGKGCSAGGSYQMAFTDSTLGFIAIADGCQARLDALNNTVMQHVQGPDDNEGPPPACPGDDVQFAFFGGLSYVWNFGDESAAVSTTSSVVYHPYNEPGTYMANVIVTNGCGQTDTLYTKVTVDENALPEANFYTENDGNMYVNEVYWFHTENDHDTWSITYTWYFDDGTVLTGSDVSYAFQTSGNHLVNLVAQNGCGQSVETRNYWIKPAVVYTCSSNFNYYIDPGTMNVSFMAQTTGNITSYSWSFGDNFTSAEINPSHAYTAPGYYNVCLTVFDNVNNCYDQKCQTIQIINESAQCNSYFTFVNTNLNVVFNNKSTGQGSLIYQWNFGDGTGSNQFSPSHAYAYPGVYQVCLIVKGGATNPSCFSTYCAQVQVVGESQCIADFTYSVSNKTVTFTNLSTNVSNYSWTFGNGATSSVRNPVYTYATGGYFNVCLNIYDNLTGCQSNICKQLYIADTNVVLCNAQFAFVVRHDSVDFINQSVGQNLSYYWDFGNGKFSSAANPMQVYAATGYYNVCLTIFNAATSCNNQYCATVYVQKDSVVPCKANFTYFVVGNTVYYTSTSLGQITNTLWNFGDGTYSTQANPSHVYAAPNFYNVCLTVYNSVSGCMDQKCKMVMAIDTNTYVLNSNFSYFANSLNVTFTNQVTGTPTNYLWNFGDGAYSSLANPVHAFPQTGFYNVCLTVYDAVHSLLSNYCSLVMVFDSSSLIPVNANFNYFVNNKTVVFSNTSTGNITNYFWDFGDGSYAFNASPTHTFTNSNYYNVCLTVYNNGTGKLSKKCEVLLIIDTTGTACRSQFAYINTGTTVTFSSQAQGNITNYFWDFGDGSYAYTANPTHTYSNPDFYNVCLKVFDNVSGCMNTSCQYVVIIDSTAYMCNASFNSFTENRNAYFTSTATGNITNYFWDFGDGQYAYIANPNHTYQTPNYYYVKHSVYDNVSQCMDDQYQYIVIIDSTAFLCKSDFDYYVNNKVANFTSTAMGNITNYFWDFGDGSYAYIANPVHTYNYPGIYDVFLTVYDNNSGCMNYKDKYVVVVDSTAFLCNAKFSYSTQNLNVVFTNKSTGSPDFYFWNFGNGSYAYTANASCTYTEPGYYNVYFSIYNSANGCMDDYSEVIVVTTPTATGLCNARFTYYPQGSSISFQNAAVGAYAKLFWDFDDGYNSNAPNPVHTFSNPGYYNVCLTVIDTTTGCFDTRCQVVFVQGQSTVVKANFSYLPASDSLKVKFNDLSYGNPTMWYWDFGDNTPASFDQHPVHYYAVNDYYRVCLTVQNNISQNMKCDYIAVGDVSNSVTAYFTYFADSVTSTGHFKNMSLGNIASYLWNFGDGYTSQQKNPSHTYQDTGYYAVCLTVTGVSGQVRSYCQDVRIGNALANPCLFSCVWPGDANNDLEANHYDIMTLGLNFGMTGPYRENASNSWWGQFAPNWSTYQINGVNNKHGDCNGDGVINLDDTLAINQNFAYSHYYQPDVLKDNDWVINCIWKPLTPKATSRKAAAKLTPPGGKPAGYIYAIGYEIKLINAQGVNFNGISVNFANCWMGTPGVNLITVVNVNSVQQTIYIGMARTDHVNVTGSGDIAEITFPLLPGFDGSQTTFTVTTLGGIQSTGAAVGVGQGFTIQLGPDREICQGESVLLSLPNVYDSYLWTGGSTDTAITVTQSGLYFVTVTNNGTQSIDSVMVTVHEKPVVNLGNDSGFCSGNTFTLNAGTGMSQYLWSTSDTTQNLVVSNAGTYSVTVTNEFGCHSDDAITLEVYPLPVIELGDTRHLCQGETVTLTPGEGFASYLWNNSNVNSSITTGISGTYSVTVTDAHQCQTSDAVQVIVHDLPVVNLGDDFTQADSATIDAGAGFEEYLWSNGDTTQTITVFQTGTYWVVVTDANGCHGTDSISITITGLPALMAIDKLSIYPNPTSDRLIIDLSTRVSGYTMIELYNAQGQLVLKREWLNTASFRNELDMENAAKGIYNLIITKGKAKVSRKIVVE